MGGRFAIVAALLLCLIACGSAPSQPSRQHPDPQSEVIVEQAARISKLEAALRASEQDRLALSEQLQAATWQGVDEGHRRKLAQIEADRLQSELALKRVEDSDRLVARAARGDDIFNDTSETALTGP
jgi:hypothetical protein